MFQWGMLIPTSETSELPVFDRIMVSIGDDQSLENDLSTYSSFLTDMKAMLEVADGRTLILIDEFGSGTEPAAGGAIAEAILHELDTRGAYGVITTHYTNLKLYASAADTGVVNGAMQFDAATVAPLFQLEVGLPGSSFAFELARKMGLPEPLVHDAEQRAGEQFVGIERNLRKIARSRRQIDEKLTRIKATDKTLEGLTDRYEKELEDIKEMRRRILDEARAEAEKIVKNANKQVESTIRTIKEAQADKQQTTEARAELSGFLGAQIDEHIVLIGRNVESGFAFLIKGCAAIGTEHIIYRGLFAVAEFLVEEHVIELQQCALNATAQHSKHIAQECLYTAIASEWIAGKRLDFAEGDVEAVPVTVALVVANDDRS